MVTTVKHTSDMTLCNYLKEYLPEALVMKEYHHSYRFDFMIYRADDIEEYKSKSLFKRAFASLKGKEVASVGHTVTHLPYTIVHTSKVTLYAPEWYSDFYDLLSHFEKVVGREVNLEYFEGEY